MLIGGALATAASALLLASASFAQLNGVVSSADANAAATSAYWTAARMRSAVPLDIGHYARGPVATQSAVSAPAGAPGFVSGWRPGSGPQPSPFASTSGGFDQTLTTPPFAAPGFPTDFINYAPFQRFTWGGSLFTFPIGTVGKLFFRQGTGNFVCSASVIGRSTLATAGHCVSNGAGSFSTNVRFCPSWEPDGTDSVRGCWNGVSMTTTTRWHTLSDIDRDVGCIVTATTGSRVANKIGNVTGILGRAFNWPTRQATWALGYPQGAPFNGNRLTVATSTEWYQLNRNAGDPQLSKYIGSDMTGGSSGGPWWLNQRSLINGGEAPAVDNSTLTDPGHPGGPFINGVNSHRRCSQAGCPAASLFVDEMGSPQFRNTAGDNAESEDVFAVCLRHVNNN
jgi:V8-like Glu-specific endopeptidase